MKRTFFITGTDTHVGKTFVTTQLMKNWKGVLDQWAQNNEKTFSYQKKYNVIGVKPIASGCMHTSLGLRNEDALLLQQAATIKLPYDNINPFCFEEPIAPHIAAARNNYALNIDSVIEACEPALMTNCDFIFIEGCGGWLTPLNEKETFADFAHALNFEVILVVSIRLGCLNHALLTAQQIQQQGLKLVGWIANLDQPSMLCAEENINTLQHRINAPLLGIMPFQLSPNTRTFAAKAPLSQSTPL